jgi:hypothetical protein
MGYPGWLGSPGMDDDLGIGPVRDRKTWHPGLQKDGLKKISTFIKTRVNYWRNMMLQIQRQVWKLTATKSNYD